MEGKDLVKRLKGGMAGKTCALVMGLYSFWGEENG